jgi:hypothetical protein
MSTATESAVETQVFVSTDIHESIDDNAMRYAISGVMIEPSQHKGKVYATATNCRMCAVVIEDGFTDESRIIPKGALPRLKKHTKSGKAVCCQFSERRWTANFDDKIHEREYSGRFPDTRSVFPDPDTEQDFIAVNIDADLLAQLAHSVNVRGEKPGAVTLLIDRKADSDIEDAIPVLSNLHSEGFGLLMPIAGLSAKESAETWATRVSQYKESRDADGS